KRDWSSDVCSSALSGFQAWGWIPRAAWADPWPGTQHRLERIRLAGMSQQTSDVPPSALPPVGSAKRVRVHHLSAAKAAGERLTMLTAYDAPTAALFDDAGIDMLLVGASIRDNMLGPENTLPVTPAATIPPARPVAR